MSEATPSPWKFLDREDPMHALICTEDGFCGIARPIANIYSGQELHKEEMRANANLIVRAVNSHDALLEACKALRDRIEVLQGTGEYGIEDKEAWEKGCAAIAAAEAKE